MAGGRGRARGSAEIRQGRFCGIDLLAFGAGDLKGADVTLGRQDAALRYSGPGP